MQTGGNRKIVPICARRTASVLQKLNCRHEHDDECGYSPATRGTPCEFECEICGVDDDMKTATPSNAKAVTVAGVQAHEPYKRTSRSVTY